jgi:hypothetical protein
MTRPASGKREVWEAEMQTLREHVDRHYYTNTDDIRNWLIRLIDLTLDVPAPAKRRAGK